MSKIFQKYFKKFPKFPKISKKNQKKIQKNSSKKCKKNISKMRRRRFYHNGKKYFSCIKFKKFSGPRPYCCKFIKMYKIFSRHPGSRVTSPDTHTHTHIYIYIYI